MSELKPAPMMRCKACNAPRAKAPCHKCGGGLFTPIEGWDDPALPDVEAIRALARQKGYAVGVHGSLERDLDLIAAPWAESACGPRALAAFIAAGINGRVLSSEEKPLGRWSCNIQIDGWFKLIDLSVAPMVREPVPPPAPAPKEKPTSPDQEQGCKHDLLPVNGPDRVRWFCRKCRTTWDGGWVATAPAEPVPPPAPAPKEKPTSPDQEQGR